MIAFIWGNLQHTTTTQSWFFFPGKVNVKPVVANNVIILLANNLGNKSGLLTYNKNACNNYRTFGIQLAKKQKQKTPLISEPTVVFGSFM